MKYRIFIFSVIILALIISGCGKQEPLAPDTKELSLNKQDASLEMVPNRIITTWDGYQIDYEVIDSGEEWIEDGVQYVRGRIIRDRLETDNDRVTGFLTVNYDYDLNLATGAGTMTSTWSVDPDKYEGTWEGRSFITFTGYMLSGFGIGRGTGNFLGMKITVNFDETPPPYDKIHEFGHIIERP
jgi:hypothetical protein